MSLRPRSHSVLKAPSLAQLYMGGSGFSTVTDTVGQNPGAQSYFHVRFVLDELYSANIAATLFAAGFEGDSDLYLFNSNTGEMVYQQRASYLPIAAFNGVLTPALYIFEMSAYTKLGTGEHYPYSATASFNGGLALAPLSATPVPEPASMTMLGLGLAAAGAKRWRARRA